MKVDFGSFGDRYEPSRMRGFLRDLHNVFSKVYDGGKLVIGGGFAIDKHFMFSATWDPGNVLSGAQTTTTVPATGVRLANAAPVMAGFDKDLQAMQLTAYVSADDVISVVLRNGTAGAIDLASGTLRVSAWRY